ncbi:MAG: hypothetical protein HW386_1447 [Gammaproteobacteria bacterium]|nr:hypothetical protein [Gammaproteobacteria bacterium]
MLTILFGILVGLSLGLTGGGGSIFAVPLLIFGLHVAPLQATTISLAAVAATSAYGSLVAGYARMIEWRAALIMVAAGMATAPAGVILAQRVPEQFIVNGFSILMLVVALLLALKVWLNPVNAGVVRARLIDDLEDDSSAICRLDENAVLRLTAPCGGAVWWGIIPGWGCYRCTQWIFWGGGRIFNCSGADLRHPAFHTQGRCIITFYHLADWGLRGGLGVMAWQGYTASTNGIVHTRRANRDVSGTTARPVSVCHSVTESLCRNDCIGSHRYSLHYIKRALVITYKTIKYDYYLMPNIFTLSRSPNV